jgi:hypothetical protein
MNRNNCRAKRKTLVLTDWKLTGNHDDYIKSNNKQNINVHLTQSINFTIYI